MKEKRGDVVVVEHFYSNGTGAKLRPALVVQDDGRNAILQETICALITTNLQFVGKDNTQVLIDLQAADGKASGLNMNSAVRCGNLFVVNERRIKNKIGSLSARLMQQVDDGLKIALGLP